MEEVHELTKPTDETLDLVHEWLAAAGISDLHYSPAKDWINVYIPVEAAERLLDTEYSVYKHEDGAAIVRTEKWSLPSHLQDHIDTIQPTTSFMRSKTQSADYKQFKEPWMPPRYQPPTNATLAKVCQLFPVTIECFRTLYSTIDYTPQVPTINKIAFNNYLNETPIRPDAALFLSKYRPEAEGSAYTLKSFEIAGGPPAQSANLTAEQLENATSKEANLDVSFR